MSTKPNLLEKDKLVRHLSSKIEKLQEIVPLKTSESDMSHNLKLKEDTFDIEEFIV